MADVAQTPTVAPVILDAGAAAALVERARMVPLSGWEFEHWPDVHLSGPLDGGELAEVVADTAGRLATDGFAIVRFGSVVTDQPEAIAASAATLLTTAFGSPFRIYRHFPSHWRALGADPERPHNKSEGIGDQPPHHDFCNAEYPPDVVCLLCLQPDPLGGGASIVAKMGGIEEMLDDSEVAALNRPVYRDGQVRNLMGVGQDANPFAVIAAAADARYRYRYVGHLLESAPDAETQAAVRALARALRQRTVAFPLQAGDLLLVNQHLAVHGKRALGAGQERLPPERRRKMLLGFLRARSH
jgi:hypothetical protein